MRLLVTRPTPDAEATAALLRAHGHTVLVAPLMVMQAVAHSPLAGPYAGVLATSANVFRALDASGIAPLRKLPLLAVGRRTAEAAREAGFAEVESADGDARDLVRLAAARFAGATRPLLYLSAEDRAANIAAMLAPHGIAVDTVVVYRMEAATELPTETRAALAAGEIDGVLHYSRRAAQTYCACALAGGLLEAAMKPVHYCLSPAVAAVLQAAGAGTVRVAGRPDEETLLDLVIR